MDEGQQTFSSREQVQILLKEYDTLRAEIISRTGFGYQVMAIGAAILTWLLSRPIDLRFVLLLFLFAAAFGGISWMAFRDIGKAAARIRELESQINRLAGTRLLKWESQWGGAVAGYWGKSKPLSDSAASQALPHKPNHDSSDHPTKPV